MKRVFRIITAVLCFCCFAAFAACDATDTSGETSSGNNDDNVTYTVNFVIDDSVVETQTVKKGEALKKPSCNTEKKGYSFEYWTFESGERVEWNSSTVMYVKKDMTLTAYYSRLEMFEVKFFNGNEQIGETQTIEIGKNFEEESAPKINGKIFKGWKKDGEDELYDMDAKNAKIVKRDLIFNAVYVESVILTYKVGENMFAEFEIEKGGEYVKPERNPEADEGQKFIGWAIEGESDKFDFSGNAVNSAVFVALFGPFTGEESISVLIIGNSYSDDTIALAYKVAESAGIKNIKIADLYIGGCTINTHIDKANGNVADYLFRYFDNDHRDTSVDTLEGTKRTLEYGVTYTDWDWIIFQQGSWASGLSSEYSRFQTLINYVKSKATSPSVKFGFNMTWAYAQNTTNSGFSNYGNDQQTMYNGILNAVKTQVATKSEIEKIIPNGTAVQNARSSFVGDNLTRDGYDHLTYDLGRYIAAMSMVKTLCGINLDKVTYAPSGLSKKYIAIAKESVNNAIKTPYEVTESAYKTVVDGMKEINITFSQGYFNSNLSSEPFTTDNLAKQFKYTQTFTRETLPVGSIIYINGWTYRPEGWINGKNESSRPNPVSTRYVEVTEAWWGDFTERAFNVFNGSDCTAQTQSEMESIFKIYIPE